MTVSVEDSDFEPDALLRCGPLLPGDATKVSDPLVLVEVLSRRDGDGQLGVFSCVGEHYHRLGERIAAFLAYGGL